MEYSNFIDKNANIEARTANTRFGNMAAGRKNNDHLFFNLALDRALHSLFGF